MPPRRILSNHLRRRGSIEEMGETKPGGGSALKVRLSLNDEAVAKWREAMLAKGVSDVMLDAYLSAHRDAMQKVEDNLNKSLQAMFGQ